jgi:hypothetical protein
MKQRQKSEMENIGKPKVDKKELIDEDGKTKIQPFNLATNSKRPDRIKDKREGHKRSSVYVNDGVYRHESTREAKQSIVTDQKRKISPLAEKIQQAGFKGQPSYIGPDRLAEEK